MILLIFLVFYQTKVSDEVVNIQQEIKILNLVNGLELSNAQMAFISEKAQDAEKEREIFHRKIADCEKFYLDILGRLRKNRMRGLEISNELKKRVHYAQEEVLKARYDMFEFIEDIACEVENILNGSQIYQIENYVPCLIPPPGKTKIGQSEKPLGIVKYLTRVKQMPDWLFETKKYDIVEKTVAKMKLHLPKGAEFNEEKEQERILQLFEEIRSNDDINFALKREDYAEQLHGDYLDKNILIYLSSRIEKFLLDPLIIPILEEKIK